MVVAFDGVEYRYSNKVIIDITSPPSKEKMDRYDSLKIRVRNDSDDWYDSQCNVILSGSFDKFAWNDYVLFIILDGKYYTFYINDYQLPQMTTDEEYNEYLDEPVYRLNEYTETEFINIFPDYESYNWRHPYDEDNKD